MDALLSIRYELFLIKNLNKKSFEIIKYVYELFSEFPDFDIVYDEKDNSSYMYLNSVIILFTYKNNEGESWLYFFGNKILDNHICYDIRNYIDDVYIEIKKMYSGLENLDLDGYKFKLINLFESTEEFIDKPKLDNLFYFYNYIPKRYSEKATIEDNVISGKMLMFKEHDDHAYYYLLDDISEKLMLLDKNKQYFVCSIPGHRMTEENSFNSFDEAVKMFPLPHNFIYLKKLIKRTHTVYKKAFGAHVKWDEEVSSLDIDSQYDIFGETVIVLDDITTTGASMQAAKFLLLLSGVKNIIFIAYGKTTHL